MSLIDLYKSIKGMERAIGNRCRVRVSVSQYDALDIKVEWPGDFSFRMLFTDIELQYVKDDSVLTKYFTDKAVAEYEKARAKNENSRSDEMPKRTE